MTKGIYHGAATMSAILENYRSALGKRNQVAKGASICLPCGKNARAGGHRSPKTD
jgi:hypothetical protein